MKEKTLLGALLLTACLPVLAQQDLHANSVQAILSLERAWADSIRNNDNRALDELFDNGLVIAENGKTVTKGEYLSTIRTRGSHAPRFAVEKISVHIFDDTAIAFGIYSESLVNRTVVKRCRFVDTWVKEKDRWLLVSAGSSPLK
jgi:ketosteroid isomerase-like protein